MLQKQHTVKYSSLPIYVALIDSSNDIIHHSKLIQHQSLLQTTECKKNITFKKCITS